MPDIHKIAMEADVIIDGYAFSKSRLGYRVLNLNAPNKENHEKMYEKWAMYSNNGYFQG